MIVNGPNWKKMIMITCKKKYLPKEKNYVAHFLPNSMLKNNIETKKKWKRWQKKINPIQPELSCWICILGCAVDITPLKTN